MPNNLFGPGDNFDLKTSHVVPALIRKIHEAEAARQKTVTIWGTGAPLREFLFVDDCADAIVFLMKHYSAEGQVNMGSGREISIADLATLIAGVIGYQGDFEFDRNFPDGAPRKLLDVSLLTNLGWQPQTSLEDGLGRTYQWYLV